MSSTVSRNLLLSLKLSHSLEATTSIDEQPKLSANESNGTHKCINVSLNVTSKLQLDQQIPGYQTVLLTCRVKCYLQLDSENGIHSEDKWGDSLQTR